MRKIRRIMVLNFFLLFILKAAADGKKSMEFRNQNITDILLVLAKESGDSIIPDETVEGKSSFFFSDQTIEQAIENFLEANNLYSERKNKVIKVSKIKCQKNTVSNTISVSANNVEPKKIIERISREAGTTILHDSLPQAPVQINLENVPVKTALEIILGNSKRHEVLEEENCFIIRKTAENEIAVTAQNLNCIERNGDLFNLNVSRNSFMNVTRELLEKADREYSIFFESNPQLENLHFENKKFEELLGLLLEQSGGDFTEKNGIIYIVELQKKNRNGKFKRTVVYEPSFINSSDAAGLVPQELSGATVRVDKNSNALIITGTNEEISTVRKFLEDIDVPRRENEFRKVDIKFLNAKDLAGLIPQKAFKAQVQTINGTNSILVCAPGEKLPEIEEFIAKVDVAKNQEPVLLKYIKTEDLMKNIPPSINKEDLMDSGYPNLIFFTGTRENYSMFKKQLELIDKPQPQIKYQILVIQYKRNEGKIFKPSISAGKTDKDSGFIFSGDLTNIMALNFDVISKFGYEFASILNSQITENRAKVFTDTTLTAITGQEIKFQNTDTYRYIEYEYDRTTGNTTKGTTQQITSGLIVSMNGWISGDNMITMNVNATVSKQNGDNTNANDSSALTPLPSTSERIVTTQVRTESGQPVIISGLIKEEENDSKTRIPIVSKIPFLGKIFQQTSKSREKSEIVIYIVPRLVKDQNEVNEHYEEFYKMAGDILND